MTDSTESGALAERSTSYDSGTLCSSEYCDDNNAGIIPINHVQHSGYPSAALDSKGLLHLVSCGSNEVACQVFYSDSDGRSWTAPVKLSQGFPDSAEFWTTWSPEEMPTRSSEDSYSIVRWSLNSNPLRGPGGQVDYVWTSKIEGNISVVYSRLVIQQATHKARGYRLLLVVSVAGLVKGITFFVVLHRKPSVLDIRD